MTRMATMAGKGDARQGTRDNRRGQARQALCAAWLRDSGLYPAAGHVGQYPGEERKSDLVRVGPRAVEVTVEPFERLAAKLRQAEQAAANSGTDEFHVWKHIGRGNNETGTVADSVLVTRARVLWPMLAELDELRGLLAASPAVQAELQRYRQACRSREAMA